MSRHTNQRDINAAERATMAINLRKQGYTLDEIAQQCGYQDRSGAFKAIKRELDKLPAPNIADLRKMEEMRLDALLKVIMPKAEGGDMWAADRVIAISKRRSEITGMDAKPDELITQQNYIKKIVLTHTVEGHNDATNH